MQEILNIIQRKLDQLLPPDFTLRREVAVNGQVVPFLAVSPIHGAIAVFIPDMPDPMIKITGGNNAPKRYLNSDEKRLAVAYWTNAAERFKSAVAVPDNMHLPETKYESEAGNVSDCGLLILTVVNVSIPCLRGALLGDKEKIVKPHFFIDGRAPESALEQYVRAYLAKKQSVAGVEWVNRNIEIWFSCDGIPPYNLKQLNQKQKELVESSTNSGYRRIKGAAGSGKSLVLAARGARLLAEGKCILFLTYNIVASRYLCEKVSEILASSNVCLDGTQVEFQHFHGLLSKIAPWSLPPKSSQKEKKDYLEIGWCQEATAILKEGSYQRYDAIFVDEGQDFRPEWWQLVRLLIKAGGEALLVADRSQNIYDREQWTESTMHGSGFRSRWITLKGCYRLPERLITPVRDFLSRFLPDDDIEMPEVPKERDGQLSGLGLNMRWIQLAEGTLSEDAASLAFREYLRLKKISSGGKDTSALQDKDVVFLTGTDACGHALENEFSLHDTLYFSTIGNRDAKLGFSMRCPSIKISTVKSFKGLESSALIIIVERGMPAVDLYVAMTRALNSEERFRIHRDSFLTVLCMEGKYADYGRTWSQQGGTFEDWTSCDASRLAKDVIIESKCSGTDSFIIQKDFFNAVMQYADGDDRADDSGEQHQILAEKLNINSNVENTHEQNIAYIHDYFFRSYTENYIFWKNVLSNPTYASYLQEKDYLNVLSYGCGTGGDIAGFLDALDGSRFFKGKSVSVSAVDGNADALKICKNVVNGLSEFHKFGINLKIETLICHADRDGFHLPSTLQKNTFDIIETSKMINEIIPLDYGAFFQFLDKVVKMNLKNDGLALIADVPVTRYTRFEISEGELGDEKEVWIPKRMTNAVSLFTKRNSDFSVVLPIVCDGCNTYCYSAKLYMYRFFNRDAPLVKSPVCCRLLARGELRNRLRSFVDEDAFFVTCYHKNGTTTSCRKHNNECGVSVSDAKDGYILQ